LCGFETEALFGETLTVYEERDGWAWVQLTRDRYVGYVPSDALSPDIDAPTHRVRALGTFVYPVPDIKSPPLMHLSINSELSLAGGDERFLMLRGGGFVVTRHVAERGRYVNDFVDIAERFIGTPYLWGGRTRVGLDCSGLVQVSLEAAGIAAPRDTDMQQAELGSDIAIADVREGVQRGDLIFWKGHVGIMTDGVTLVHANAHHMAVTAETLPEAIERIAAPRRYRCREAAAPLGVWARRARASGPVGCAILCI
jgi:cell wall-associated NlpC family hydrolase